MMDLAQRKEKAEEYYWILTQRTLNYVAKRYHERQANGTLRPNSTRLSRKFMDKVDRQVTISADKRWKKAKAMFGVK